MQGLNCSWATEMKRNNKYQTKTMLSKTKKRKIHFVLEAQSPSKNTSTTKLCHLCSVSERYTTIHQCYSQGQANHHRINIVVSLLKERCSKKLQKKIRLNFIRLLIKQKKGKTKKVLNISNASNFTKTLGSRKMNLKAKNPSDARKKNRNSIWAQLSLIFSLVQRIWSRLRPKNIDTVP